MSNRSQVLCSAQLAALAVAACFALPGCRAVLGPPFEPTAALVAIQRPGSDVAHVGPVRFQTGDTIHLFAVLVGQENDEPVYYTSATKLELPSGLVADDRLRPFPDRPIRCLWQTIEGPAPFVRIGSLEQLKGLEFTNYSHPDWGLECKTTATITARQRETVAVPEDERRLAFGVQNYQVWVELLDQATDLVAQRTLRSDGSDALFDEPGDFARAEMLLDGTLARASSVFGRTQLEWTDDLPLEGQTEILRLHQLGVTWSRLALLTELLGRDAGDHFDWQLTDFSGKLPFRDLGSADQGIRPGDLMRVSDRVLVVFRDVGQVGVLDADDLGFDFDRGAVVRRLGDVFVGEGDVEWVSRAALP